MQAEANLPNVTLVERVEDDELETFLSAADVWLIPYRKNVAGVSVPSRFYNLLAVGRPVLLVSEPEAEAALTVIEHDLGWVVAARQRRRTGESGQSRRGLRRPRSGLNARLKSPGVSILSAAMADYCGLIRELLHEEAGLDEGRSPCARSGTSQAPSRRLRRREAG